METKNVFKNFLTIYKYLPTLISSIDKLVEVRCVNSSNYNFSFLNTTDNQINAIMNLTERKVFLINLKVLIMTKPRTFLKVATNTVLGELRPEYAKILILRFVDGFSAKSVSEKLGINLRTCFRRIDSALKSFTAKMNEFIKENNNTFLGKNRKCFESIFSKLNNWNLNDDEKEEFDEKVKTMLCNSLFKEIKKVSVCS